MWEDFLKQLEIIYFLFVSEYRYFNTFKPVVLRICTTREQLELALNEKRIVLAKEMCV